ARTGRSIRTALASLVIYFTDRPAPLQPNSLGGEGAATATGGLGLWVLDREPRPLETVHIVDFGSLKERSTLRVHDDLDATLFNHGIVVGHLRLKSHSKLIAVTSAAFHIDPQAHDILLFHHQFLDLLLCNRRNCNHANLLLM